MSDNKIVRNVVLSTQKNNIELLGVVLMFVVSFVCIYPIIQVNLEI